jgi:putative membrane protein
MIANGFLGTRADLVIDLVVVLFAVLPFALMATIRLASKRRFQTHRTLQILLFSCAFLVTLALEVDLRMTDLLVITKQRPMYGSMLTKTIFLVHVVIAVLTFLSWLTLLLRSKRRFRQNLPGEFSRQHRLWGQIVLVGVTLTSITGITLYVVVFVF